MYKYICMYVCIYIYTYIYIFICMYMYIYIEIYIAFSPPNLHSKFSVNKKRRWERVPR